MKFSLFVHMERFDPGQSHGDLYRELVELVQTAERGGFHSAWVGEHHAMEFTISPNPFIVLADLARVTDYIRLGTGTIVAPNWHPIRLVGEAAMTDIITGGRLDIGIARGAYQFEYDRVGGGMDAMEAGARMRELIPAIRELWQGDYAHDGEYWSFPSATCVPKPAQRPHPPLWVAARDPNSHDFAVSQGCHVMVTPLWHGDDEVATLIGRFNDACAAHPETPRRECLVLRHTYVGASDAEVDRACRDFSRYYNYFGGWFKNERPIRNAFIQEYSDAEIAANEMFSPEVMRRNLIIGKPAEVIDRVKSYEAMGYDHYSFWIDSGMTFAQKKKSLELFINEVMPAFDDAPVHQAG
jgi:alkanesulfonate monooxygenase SsuD/methylene tetrahydromethanopterin reductase-like flavin-dependent oxidoreductase (luciferase family)